MFAIHTKGEARFNMRHGFAFKIELFLESREKCVVAQLGPTFVLELDEDLAPIASMFLADPGSRRGPQVRIDTQDSELPLRRWVSVGLVHDGRVFRLLVDGEEVDLGTDPLDDDSDDVDDDPLAPQPATPEGCSCDVGSPRGAAPFALLLVLFLFRRRQAR